MGEMSEPNELAHLLAAGVPPKEAFRRLINEAREEDARKHRISVHGGNQCTCGLSPSHRPNPTD